MRSWALAAAISSMLATPALAEDWAREVGGWTVGRTGDMCIMTMEYEGAGATNLTLAVNEETEKTYLSVDNYLWSAKEGEVYELAYHLGEWVYTAPAIGTEANYIRKGFITSVSSEFLSDFAKSDDLEITRGDILVDDLSLKGSAAGLAVFERCRTELARDMEQRRRDRERLSHIPTDPFADDLD